MCAEFGARRAFCFSWISICSCWRARSPAFLHNVCARRVLRADLCQVLLTLKATPNVLNPIQLYAAPANYLNAGAEVTLKRFWKAAYLEEKPCQCVDWLLHFVDAISSAAFRVTLDKRPLKTPGGNILEVPKSKRMLATLIAFEWDNQERLIKPHALPLVRAN